MERQLFISLLCIIIKNVLLSSKECSVKNSRECLELLLSHEAEVNIKADVIYNKECSELLLSHEAEVNIKANVIYNNIWKEACQ